MITNALNFRLFETLTCSIDLSTTGTNYNNLLYFLSKGLNLNT